MNTQSVDTDMNDIIDRIRSRRIELNMSYQDLANKTGLSKSTLQRYETGAIKNMPLDKLKILSNALDVSQTYILGLDEEYTHATSLSKTYFDSIMKWSEDRIFDSIETICIREHFFDLLLRYKELLATLSNSKYSWNNEKDSYSKIYKNRKDPLTDNEIEELFFKQELERPVNDLVNWINAFPNWLIREKVKLSLNDNDK